MISVKTFSHKPQKSSPVLTVQTHKNGSVHHRTTKAALTVVLYPLDRFSSLPDAVENILESTEKQPVNILVVECNAPDSIRYKLEKIAQKNRNVNILYTAYTPSVPEIINLALPHLNTPNVFFMAGHLKMNGDWYSSALSYLKEGEDKIISPLLPESGKSFPVSCQAFMTTRHLIEKFGEWDTQVSSLLADVDLNNRIRRYKIPVVLASQLHCQDEHPALKPMDLKLLETHFNHEKARQSILYLRDKWNLPLEHNLELKLADERSKTRPVKPFILFGRKNSNPLERQITFLRKNLAQWIKPWIQGIAEPMDQNSFQKLPFSVDYGVTNPGHHSTLNHRG